MLYRRLLTYVKPHRKAFATALVCMVIFGASDGYIPFLVKDMLDKVFGERDERMLLILPFLIVGFAVIRAIADFGQQYLMSSVGHRVVQDIRNEIDRKVLALSSDFFVRRSSAEVLSSMTSDVALLRSLVTDTAAAAIRDSVRIVALVSAAVYLDPWLAFFALLVFPVGILPVIHLGKRMRKLSKRGQDAIGNLSAVLQEAMLGLRVVKVFCREDHEAQRFRAENARLTETLIRSERVRALSGPINEVLASFAIAGVLLYGGYTVIEGDRTPGAFIAFLFALFFMYDPFKKLGRLHAVVQQGLAGAERVFELLDTEATVKEPTAPKPLPAGNEIRLNDVSFSYLGQENNLIPALGNISLTIPEGRKVALVGFSGAGKSTLVDLLPRFVDPTSGTVTLGGIDLRDLSLPALRSRIAMVGQHTFLFNDTVYANIAYGNPAASEEDVHRAAKAAYAYDFILGLPNGFNSVIGESGLMLSGGERQRLAIARAILKNAPILILDEATASLDNRAEREVQLAIEALERGRTTVVIAHRLSTVRDADQIIVLSQGRIVEVGTHDELLGRAGEYSKLYDLQFRGESRAAVSA